MKIVHIRDAAQVGQNLVRILNSMGHHAEQILPAENPSPNLVIKGLSMLKRAPEAWTIGRQVRRGNYDIVHLHVANSGWMAALGNYDYVVHCHGSEIRPGLQLPIRRELALYTLKRAQHVFYVTPDLQRHIMPHRPDATLLPNPVDVDIFGPRDTIDDREAVRILLATPLTTIKMPQRAYEAIDLLRKRPDLPPIHVAALGFGKDRAHYKHLLATPEITFLPPRPHEEMADLYNDYDIVVGQFGLGALGLIELEAMACAKPVVSQCDASIFRSSYGDLPPMLSTETAEQAADALEQLVRDADLRRTLGQQARAWICRHHGFDAIGAKLVSVYQSLLA